MDSNYFIFCDKDFPIELERFHICNWEFKNRTALVEFGCEITNGFEHLPDLISLCFYVPWLKQNHTPKDLYDSLKEPENCKFIFNDSVVVNKYLDGGNKTDGVIHEFKERDPLCLLPVDSRVNNQNNTITISIDLKPFKLLKNPSHAKPNFYFRFYIETDIKLITTRKNGFSRSTIIYDIKVNQRRNLPFESDIRHRRLCKINTCFCFNILPNAYEFSFFDATSIKNIRNLEYDSFKKYLGDRRVKENELIVVFNKKEDKDSYSFFSIFKEEKIGIGQLAFAIIVSLFSGIILFIPSYRNDKSLNFFSIELWLTLPLEVYLVFILIFVIVVMFIWPKFTTWMMYKRNRIF